MKIKLVSTAFALFVVAAAASAADLAKGTEVNLTFQQAVNSKTAKAGNTITFTVAQDVSDSNGKVILHSGEHVTGVISKVDKKDHFGKNARIRISLNPVDGITLEPRDKGAVVGGTRTDEAVAASGGAALVFGPLGLVGGYFVVGHSVNIKQGANLRTVVN